jgi:hypothetical protein
LNHCTCGVEDDHLTGAVIAQVHATVQHDGRCDERVGVFEIDSLWWCIAIDEQDNSRGTGEHRYKIARYELFRNLDGPVVWSLGFGDDDTVADASDSSGFDHECVAVVGDHTSGFGAFCNRYPRRFFGHVARFV